MGSIVKASHDAGELQAAKNGSMPLPLDSKTVRNYLVRGQGNLSDQECLLFIGLCKARGLNPFANEAYLVKYGSAPASTIVAATVFDQRAANHPDYDGCESGIIVKRGEEYINKRGTCVLPGETLVGGWAEVFFRQRKHSEYAEVSLSEYSTGKSMWREPSQGGKPAVMINKVATVAAKRKAFPEEFGGMYTADEMGSIRGTDKDYTDVDEEVRREAETTPYEPPCEATDTIVEDIADTDEPEAIFEVVEDAPTAEEVPKAPPAKKNAVSLTPLRVKFKQAIDKGNTSEEILAFMRSVVDKDMADYTNTQLVKVMSELTKRYELATE